MDEKVIGERVGEIRDGEKNLKYRIRVREEMNKL
jgi:hypothetical protein